MEIPSAAMGKRLVSIDAMRERSREGEKRTFQTTHDSIETFRTQFVVTEGAQQLADDDVRLFSRLERPHIREDKLDRRTPFEC